MNIFKKTLYGDVTLTEFSIAFLLILFGLLFAKVVSLYVKRFLKDKIAKEHLDIIAKLIFYTIFVIALIIALPFLGFKLSGLLVTGGVVGLAIGFASQNIVGNLISGIFLIIERPIKLGNAVNIDGTFGIVEDIHIMSTTLRTFDGIFMRVPNQKVFTANITNFASHPVRRFEYTIGIRYSDDAIRAIDLIKGLIDQQPFALKKPEPQVFVDNLGDSSVNLIVRIWSPNTEWFNVKIELLWKIKTLLEQEGIEIPFPQRVIWQGNDSFESDMTAERKDSNAG
ncbi:MAG: mechanosensitive ion channel family protein [SAR324 cluster bacterium]|nr:mechanosensitive ion channel family protein [SAR324 cluster bacterium]